jgi:cell division transport system permease protein
VNRSGHILKEFARNVYRYPFTALGSLLSLTLLFLLFDLYWIGAGTFDRLYDRLLSDLQMEVFVAEDVTEAQIPELRQKIAEVEGISAIQYISKEQARELMMASVGMDLLAGYDTTNPLPRSFILDFDTDYLNTGAMERISSRIRSMPAVVDSYYDNAWLSKTERTRSVVLQFGMALGILILVTALISSVNNIRLMTRARSEGLAQMRLLGASRTFLFAPMFLEGFIIGSVSAAFGWLLLLYARQQVSFTQFELTFPDTWQIVAFCLATGVLGVIGGYFGVRRLLLK